MLSCLDPYRRPDSTGDTSLIVEVERDTTVYMTNVFWWWQDTRMDWVSAPGVTAADGALDLVITNVVLMDPVLGIVKTDIGIIGSDSQGMGRIGEVICRTWQLASKMKDQQVP